MTPNQFAYHAWLASQILPHGTRPTRLHVRVGRFLARWQHSMPSHGKLARAAGCCVRTVQNALNRFRELGMLDWRHQGAIFRHLGRRRLPNRYLFLASFLLLKPRIQAPILHLGKLREKWGLAGLHPLVDLRMRQGELGVLV